MAKVTVKGRLLNNAIFNPKEDEYGSEKYTALVVLEPGEEKKIEAARDAAISDKFGDKVPKNLADWTVREGDDPDYELTDGQNFINAKSTRAPQAVYKKDGVIHAATSEDNLIYAGAYVYVSLDVYAYLGDKAKKNPPGVSVGLRAVMFWKHGEKLGDSVDASSEFGDFDSEDLDLDGDDSEEVEI